VADHAVVALVEDRAEPLAGARSGAGPVLRCQRLTFDVDLTSGEGHNHALAYNNLGNALKRLGQLDEAMDCFNRALALNPNLPQLHFHLANALRDQGRLGEAIASYQRALELNPRYAGALLNLGRVLHHRQGRLGEALAVYDRALLIKPDFAEAHLNRGNVLRDEGRLAEALAAYDRALLIKPDFAGAHLNRGNLFKDQARFAEALDAYQEALRLSPNLPDAYSNYLFCLNYDPAQGDAALAEAHRLWGERHSPLPDVFTTYSNSRDPDKPLRVGLVSADFGRHPVGYFLDRVLAAADPGVLQYICYSGRLREDALTERLRAHACGWRSTIRVSDRQLAELIRVDGIDILSDLAGHTAGNRLGCFRLRPAPVQVHWAGYCHSIPLMDYSLWDPIQVPGDQERWFVERIVRLPDVRWCYAAPDYAPPVTPRCWSVATSPSAASTISPRSTAG
jgi:predicted O-linked N-acetylglucosamine transferase (SPINDLY family)